MNFLELIFLVPIVAILAGIVQMVLKHRTENLRVRERETTRREIAAYIAEGSFTPEQGERLMAAGESPPSKT